jgi:hypothetical protein
MSDTPRTDTETWRDEMDHVDTDYTFAQSFTVSADFARQLERELADAKETIAMLEIRHGATMLCHQAQIDKITKQRDALAEAGNQLLDSLYSQDWRKLPAIRSMRKALAAVKGNSHE